MTTDRARTRDTGGARPHGTRGVPPAGAGAEGEGGVRPGVTQAGAGEARDAGGTADTGGPADGTVAGDGVEEDAGDVRAADARAESGRSEAPHLPGSRTQGADPGKIRAGGSQGDAGRAAAGDEGTGDADDSRTAPPSDGRPETEAPADPGVRAGDAPGGEADTADEAAAGGICRAGVRGPLGGLRVRGRHRRPRHRKVLLAAGGLALAAGALSLVRLAPESGVGGLGAAEAEPQPGHGGVTHGAVTSAAAVTPGPADLAPTTAPFGGESSLPVPGTGATPAASSSPATAARPSYPPGSTPLSQAPEPPHAPAPGPTTRPPATSGPEPRPTPTPAPSREAPGRGTDSPAPPPGNPGLCLPVVGLCVDLGLGGAGH